MSTKLKLIIANFLQFAAWGTYLISMGGYLSKVGLASHIGSFYAVSGVVALFMPALIGIVADKWIPAQKLYGICHLISAVFISAVGYYGYVHGESVDFQTMFLLYAVSITFYMPTLSLSYSVSYNALKKDGYDIVKSFPPIRIFGTIGFLLAMLVVDITGFQHTYHQFFLSGIIGAVLAVYAFFLPSCPVNPHSMGKSFVERTGLKAFTLFKRRNMAVFFIFSMFLGVLLHISEAYAHPYLTWLEGLPQFSDSYVTKHPNMLISFSRLSETFCILLIPFFMKRFGIKSVMLISMLAWAVHFLGLGLGNPSDGLWLFAVSMLIYGVAFDFFNISGSLYVDNETDPSARSSAQGLYTLMSNGIGTAVGTWTAQWAVNHFVYHAAVPDWASVWYIFAGFALLSAVLFALFFRR